MNKTVTVNIGGLVFHIEEQAYEKLRHYLEAIRGYFTSSDGRDEIIQDIESRIAEIFSERIGTSRQVVTDTDVEFMINAMGRPEQVAGEDAESTSNSGNYSGSNADEKTYRRLYRDPDDKVVGGICSGISHYIGVDPIWLRLIFGIAFFVYGAGIGLYILLLIIIPKAKTTAEKLEMKGRPVNIESIKRTIEEEVEDIKNRFNADKSQRKAPGTTSKVARFFEVLGEIIISSLKLVGKIIGGFFMLIALALLFTLFTAILAMAGVIGNVDIPVHVTRWFLTDTQLQLTIFASILAIGIPLVFLLYRIARSLFKLKNESKTLNRIGGALWGLGVIIVIYLAIDISRDFREKDQERVTLPILQPASDTLQLTSLDSDGVRTEDYYDNGFQFENGFSISDEGDSMKIGRVKLDIIAADDDNFSLVKIVSANGTDRRAANKNLQSITYDILQENSTLKFSEYFVLDKNNQYRNQKIQLILKVPVGKSVYLSEDMEDIIYDIQNITNTYDGDMVGHTWTMTGRGLECVNCDLPIEKSSDRNKVKMRINGQDVNIDEVNDSVNWKNKDVRINIDENGVVIDAKEKADKKKDKNW
jgi:phage shock protein PspC (stress-responsive transcriptional regulator)